MWPCCHGEKVPGGLRIISGGDGLPALDDSAFPLLRRTTEGARAMDRLPQHRIRAIEGGQARLLPLNGAARARPNSSRGCRTAPKDGNNKARRPISTPPSGVFRLTTHAQDDNHQIIGSLVRRACPTVATFKQ